MIDNDFDETTPGQGYDHFQQIQDQITEVREYRTVYVSSSIYYQHVNISKTTNWVGLDKNTTVIDGGGNGSVVTLVADWRWINLIGFTLPHSGTRWNNAVIYGNSNNTTITENIITDTSLVISFDHSSNRPLAK